MPLPSHYLLGAFALAHMRGCSQILALAPYALMLADALSPALLCMDCMCSSGVDALKCLSSRNPCAISVCRGADARRCPCPALLALTVLWLRCPTRAHPRTGSLRTTAASCTAATEQQHRRGQNTPETRVCHASMPRKYATHALKQRTPIYSAPTPG